MSTYELRLYTHKSIYTYDYIGYCVVNSQAGVAEMQGSLEFVIEEQLVQTGDLEQ